MTKPTTENYISEFAAMWSRLSHNQQRFAVAMLQCASKKEAAEMIGLEPQTVYRWNGDVEQIVAFMRNDYAAAAVGILAANNAKAAMVKIAGLDSDNEKIRQDVASEILDRNLGKATQRQEVTGAAGAPLEIVYVNDWRSEN